MNKKKTGVRYTPKRFRELNICTHCGRAGEQQKETMCEVCKAKNYRNCEVCDIVLRKGLSTFYTYDSRDAYREGVDFNPVKELVREFVYEKEPEYPQCTKNTCVGCKNWKNNIKNWCWVCDREFLNTQKNYKLNGNVCRICSACYESNQNG